MHLTPPRIAAALAVVLSLSVTAAHADGPPGTAPFLAPTSAPVDHRTQWYGWQILAIDAALMAALVASLDERTDSVASLSLLGLIASGPIVHAANGKSDRILSSLGLRLGLPLAGLALGSAGCDDKDESLGEAYGCAAGMIGGIAIGTLVAEVIDISRSTRRVAVREAPFTPVIRASRDATTFGLAGRF